MSVLPGTGRAPATMQPLAAEAEALVAPRRQGLKTMAPVTLPSPLLKP